MSDTDDPYVHTKHNGGIFIYNKEPDPIKFAGWEVSRVTSFVCSFLTEDGRTIWVDMEEERHNIKRVDPQTMGWVVLIEQCCGQQRTLAKITTRVVVGIFAFDLVLSFFNIFKVFVACWKTGSLYNPCRIG
jgi:hypothetical protein